MRHRDSHYPGEHDAIIKPDLWDSVANQLADRRVDRRSERNLRHGNLLGGLLYDGLGRPMRTCSASKASKTYHYYASNTGGDGAGPATTPTGGGERRIAWRMPAHDLEKLVGDDVRQLLADPARIADSVEQLALDKDGLTDILLAARKRSTDTDSSAWRELIDRIEVHNDRVVIAIDITRLRDGANAAVTPISPLMLSIPIVRLRRGKEVRLLIPGNDGGLQASADPALIKLLATAFAARDAVNAAGRDQKLDFIAKAQGYSLEYFSLLLRLSMLSRNCRLDQRMLV